ncbi:Predicted arabinose efflux permease, MFS family [Jatrophihabitans endophyticus]|uniref:Predicted arabinose efflux permease, MFS family n=1 Tax=Jatrophihabitans endophyticus TaxID=1206085 RepID=A0A1M5LSF3_9ACTN|nr:MFS transporter [Jatrophihabitans endophyticus]SHG67988.1 Predicted arabinose efflux permease, MFS family [Jatrophihabitans endophyticus]
MPRSIATAASSATADDPTARRASHDRRVALSVTTVGILAATLNSSILLISLPAIFRGLGLDPLAPQNISYLLWMLMGFLLVTAVLVVTFGRLGDQYGRAKLFNLGFLIFTVGSIGCALVPNSGGAGALEIIVWRVVQGVGGAMLMANSTAIITDAFPPARRGFALGVNQVAALAGSFLGLVIGGVLSEWDWRAVFWVSVPVGVWGTWMGYRTLHDKPRDTSRRVVIDWWGNLAFGIGLIALLVGVTYGLQPYGGHTMGWTSPFVLTCVGAGVVLLVAFVMIENRVADPMINMRLFRVRAFAAGQAVNLLASMSRGGLQFMLIIWLQGIWLPLHGYAFEDTPLWAGIYMVPLTLGFLVAGPASGALSDRFGARAFATGGLLLTAATFLGLILLPANFNYVLFAGLIALNGIGMGLMAAPNSAAIMNAVPAAQRGAASGIRATGMNAGMVLSMGGFFTLMAVGLASRLPQAMHSGLVQAGVDPAQATAASHASPVGILFAAFLGGNPIQELVPHASPAVAGRIDSGSFFPNLIADPFRHGLTIAFTASIVMLLIAAGASLLRGKKFVHEDADGADAVDALAGESVGEAVAREGAALAVPAAPGEDVAYEAAVAGRARD